MAELEQISIIIPTHNRGGILATTLASYLEQGCREVIVVDDAGTDETPVMLAELSRQRKRSFHCSDSIGVPNQWGGVCCQCEVGATSKRG